MDQVNVHIIIQQFANSGVPMESIILLLLFPLIATFVALLRNTVGIKTFGIYTPTIITFAFYQMGLKYGIAVFLIVIIVGMATRFSLKQFRLLPLPRTAINLTVVTLAVLLSLVFGGSLQRTGFAATAIFPLLIIISLGEKFVAVQIEKDSKQALILAAETLIVAIGGYFILSWEALHIFIGQYPWVILLVIPFNFALGKWTGLRVREYHRFRDVIKKIQ